MSQLDRSILKVAWTTPWLFVTAVSYQTLRVSQRLRPLVLLVPVFRNTHFGNYPRVKRREGIIDDRTYLRNPVRAQRDILKQVPHHGYRAIPSGKQGPQGAR